MYKKILIILVFNLLFCSNFLLNKVYALENKLDAFILYDKETYEKGDQIDISIDLPKFVNLFECIIRIDYDLNVLNPIKDEFDNYFYLDSHSIFDNFLVNKLFGENMLYAEMIVESTENINYSNYQNNLCHIKFTATKYIKDIKEVLNNSSIKLLLFDSNHNQLEYDLLFEKRLIGKWCDNLTIEVGNKIVLENIFSVENRKNNEYKLFLEKDINTNLVESQIIQIGIYDLITGDYKSFSAIINVVDNISPVINGDNVYLVNDTDLINLSFYKSISVSDNYDMNPTISYKLYNINDELLNTNDFLISFKNDYYLKVVFTAVDSSGNVSEEFIQTYKLIDTTSPTITCEENIRIDDVKITEFDPNNYFSVSDNLDRLPSIVYTYYNAEGFEINELEDALTVNNYCIIKAYAVDNASNVSDEIMVKIYLNDTLPPNILSDSVAFIEDIYIKNIVVKNLINVSDNDFRECIISYELFLKNDNSMLTENETIENLLLGKIVTVNYVIKDYSMNQSLFELEIVPIDTTPPTINCNVEDNKLYKELSQIETTISDNFLYEVNTTVYLDGAIYQNEIIPEGKHYLQIIAVDKANNKATYECNFVVSTKGTINNIINGNLKINNVILISVIVGITLFICAIEIVYYKVKKKNKN